jgi:hypothetical protein
MATARKRKAAKRNIRNTQRGRRGTSSRAQARPAGRRRARPGERGGGRFFRIEVAPASRFITFRYHDVGKKGGIERIAGQRPDGTWGTAAWLISKDMAHAERGRLVPDTADARKVLSALGATPRRVTGDRFQAKAQPSVLEHTKRKPAMRRAQPRKTSARKGRRH